MEKRLQRRRGEQLVLGKGFELKKTELTCHAGQVWPGWLSRAELCQEPGKQWARAGLLCVLRYTCPYGNWVRDRRDKYIFCIYELFSIPFNFSGCNPQGRNSNCGLAGKIMQHMLYYKHLLDL